MTATETRTRPHVVVVGGGFGGLAAAGEMRGMDVDVTLVDRHSYNTFQPLLYQVATAALNPGDVTYFLRAAVGRQPNLRVRKGDVTGIDPAAQKATLDNGDVLGYDYLVVASGVTTNYFGIPGAQEHALALYTRIQALQVRDAMFQILESAAAAEHPGDVRMVVVGGGATGVEMAGALGELNQQALPKVYPEIDPGRTHIELVEMADHLLAPFAPRMQRYAAKALEKRGVTLRLGTEVREVRRDGVVVGDGEFVPAQLVVWATGITVPAVVAEWGLPQGKGGRILVGSDLRVHGWDNVFAVGDIAVGPDSLPQLAQPALQGGRHAGRQIRALVRGQDTAPFHYRDKGILATIGRSSAVAEVTHLPKVTGFVAWVIWLGVHIVSLLGNRNRLATLVNLSVRYLAWPRSFNAIVGEVPTPGADG
ncbi:MAG: NAD(P)/FAD-dependent oxidoreductase [Nocardioidaceae bacterium]